MKRIAFVLVVYLTLTGDCANKTICEHLLGSDSEDHKKEIFSEIWFDDLFDRMDKGFKAISKPVFKLFNSKFSVKVPKQYGAPTLPLLSYNKTYQDRAAGRSNRRKPYSRNEFDYLWKNLLLHRLIKSVPKPSSVTERPPLHGGCDKSTKNMSKIQYDMLLRNLLIQKLNTDLTNSDGTTSRPSLVSSDARKRNKNKSTNKFKYHNHDDYIWKNLLRHKVTKNTILKRDTSKSSNNATCNKTMELYRYQRREPYTRKREDFLLKNLFTVSDIPAASNNAARRIHHYSAPEETSTQRHEPTWLGHFMNNMEGGIKTVTKPIFSVFNERFSKKIQRPRWPFTTSAPNHVKTKKRKASSTSWIQNLLAKFEGGVKYITNPIFEAFRSRFRHKILKQ